MQDFDRTSLLEMAGGAIKERADFELTRAIDNILDVNTDPTTKRIINIKLTLAPDADRRMISVSAQASSKLAPTTAIQTALCLTGENENGEAVIAEMVPQIPGQMDMNGYEQRQPKIMKLVDSI